MPAIEPAPPIVSLNEAQAFARIETHEEEALVAGFVRTASALCESFIGQMVIARPFCVDIRAKGEWERLPVTPVRAILSVEAVDAAGAVSALAPGDYSTDVDSSGDGWVRGPVRGEAARLRVSGTAGISEDENCVPEPIRQGVLRLVAHLFAVRDGPGGEPPAAVTALWRPYRRLRLA